jgi:transcriptional regulator with XRE-family HTH domain
MSRYRPAVDGGLPCTYELQAIFFYRRASGGAFEISMSSDLVTEDEEPERNSRRANPMDVHVGGRVRMRRMLLGMSQEKLGEQLGLTFQQVQKYEKGVNRIGASRLFEMAKVLGVPVQFFYDDAPFGATGLVPAVGFAERPSDSYVVDFLATREGLELNKAFARITDPKIRKAICDLVKSLAGEDT